MALGVMALSITTHTEGLSISIGIKLMFLFILHITSVYFSGLNKGFCLFLEVILLSTS